MKREKVEILVLSFGKVIIIKQVEILQWYKDLSKEV